MTQVNGMKKMIQTKFKLILSIFGFIVLYNQCYSQNESSPVASKSNSIEHTIFTNEQYAIDDKIGFVKYLNYSYVLLEVSTVDQSQKRYSFNFDQNYKYECKYEFIIKDSSILLFFRHDDKTTFSLAVLEIDLYTKKEIGRWLLPTYKKNTSKKKSVVIKTALSNNQ